MWNNYYSNTKSTDWVDKTQDALRLFTTIQNTSNKNSLKWDLLVWGDDDWYYENPWTVFFILCISIFILGYKTILNNSTVAYTDAIVQTKEVKLEVFLNI